ncbi:MAG: methionyl-tRNA formyltransferase [Pseudomonadales bacterium]
MTTPALRLVFAGTPEFAALALSALINSEHCEVVAVYTQPDRPRGRGKKLVPSPVKSVATDNAIAVCQPLDFKQESDLQILKEWRADIMVVAAYGLLLPQSVLDTPRLGCINIHASLLPRWRGAAPVERAIEAGDAETGVTIMQMDAGLDTGDMLLKKYCEITDSDTGDSIRAKLVSLGSEAIVESIEGFARGAMNAEQQENESANYAKKINKPETAIDWTDTAENIDRKIRAFYSDYTCFTLLDGERIKVGPDSKAVSGGTNSNVSSKTPGSIIAVDKDAITVQCGTNSVQLKQLQFPGGRMMSVRDCLNSRAAQLQPGGQFEPYSEQ